MEDISASDTILDFTKKFGTGLIDKTFPNKFDGLKDGQRRIFWSLRNDMNDIIPSSQLIASTIKYHPHGDATIYETAVRLAQNFNCNPPLIAFESSVGTYSNPIPAKGRYTKSRIPDYTKDLFYKSIDINTLPKRLSDTHSGYEVEYYIPTIPLALYFGSDSIGFGYNSEIMSRNLGDICDIVIAYANHRKNSPISPFDYTKIVELFLPDTPIDNILINREELIEKYKHGMFNAQSIISGTVKLCSNKIIIYTLPYGTPYGSIMETMLALMKVKNGWYDRNIERITDNSSERNIGNLVIELNPNRNVFEAWSMISKKISFTGSLNPNNHFSEYGSILKISPIALLRYWYEARCNILISSKKYKISKLTTELRQLNALLLICDHTDEVIKIIKNNNTIEAIKLFRSKFQLTTYQAYYIHKAPLNTLGKDSKEELLNALRITENNIEKILTSFKNIDNEIAEEAQYMKDKYTVKRKCISHKFIGYVKVDGGNIQFENTKEIYDILNDFPKSRIEIYTYNGSHMFHVNAQEKINENITIKYTDGDHYSLPTNSIYTINIADGAACCVKGFQPGFRSSGYFYTSHTAKMICKDGTILTGKIDDHISLKKTICRGANTDIIYVYPENKNDHFIISMNDDLELTNTVTIQRIRPTTTKIQMRMKGKNYITHSNISKDVFFNLFSQCINRTSARIIVFKDLNKLMEDKDVFRIDINTMKKYNKLIEVI